MKKFNLLIVICLALAVLSACTKTGINYRHQVDNGLTQEYWMSHVNTNPALWTRQGDRWFFTGEPARFDQFTAGIPINKAMSATMVTVPDFHNIRVSGPFQLQIFGHQEHNSVFVIGPNESARQAAIEVRGNTLFIQLPANCKTIRMDQVIIRIGIRELNNLVAEGCARVEGTQIFSRHLNIATYGNANILLEGNINLANVNSVANGTISVIGAYTPALDIRAVANGSVNVSGRVGIHHIVKAGGGSISIIGADSDALDIQSSGFGITTISGFVNLKKVNATQNSRVYAYWVNSDGTYVNSHDRAVVGLAGSTQNIDIEVDGMARFEGKYLHSGNTYVRTRGTSHANVNPYEKLFANAMDNSSIYFFGSPNVVSRYTMDNGLVVPVWSNTCPTPSVPPPSSWSWGKTRAYFQMKHTKEGNMNKPCCST